MAWTAPPGTHRILNQSPIFADLDLVAIDVPLREAIGREGGRIDAVAALGPEFGSRDRLELGRLANENEPRLRAFDQKGHRLDEVEFHPAYHALMRRGRDLGLHASTWEGGSHVDRAARFYLAAQAECGHLCPLTMTHAAPAALTAAPDLATFWRPRILSRGYDPVLRAPEDKAAVHIGMGMTEKQGGTDVRANTTVAEPTGERGLHRLTGHKWFLSAPMSDAFLVLAQAPAGLSCFLLPRILPDGTRNALAIQRLKDKLGNRSNASAEVEFDGAQAALVGEEGRGLAAILPMVTLTRLDCALASAGLMRLGLVVAIHHTRHRQAFGRPLAEQPLMRAVLADLALHVEAAVALVFRLARAFDHAQEDEAEAAFARVMTPVVKYWVCKSAPAALFEAMECLGGNGYVEEGLLARAYREAPVNAIWEGSGNVMALDLLRALSSKAAAKTVLSQARASASPAISTAADDWERRVRAGPSPMEARHLAEDLAQIVAAGLLAGQAPGLVAEAFVQTRLSGRMRSTMTGIADEAAAACLLGRAFAD